MAQILPARSKRRSYAYATGLVTGLLMAVLWAGLAQAAMREVRVGVYANPPKIFAKKDGQPSGILGDVLVAIAAQEGWTLVPTVCEWQDCLDALQDGQLDLMPDVAYTAARAQDFDFHTIPALASWSQLYKHKAESISSVLDLAGKRVAVLKGSVQAGFLNDLLASFGVTSELVAVNSFEQGFAMAAARQVNAVAANRFYGHQKANELQLENTSIVFMPAQLFFATPKNRNADLLQAIDSHLKAWQARDDSPYAKALDQWLQTPPRVVLPNWLAWALALLLLGLSGALWAAHWLRRQVALKTSNLRASQDQLNTILNGVDAAIYIKDLDLRYQYVNQTVCASFGRPAHDIVGQRDDAFLEVDTARKFQLNDLKVTERGERVEEEETRITATGQQRVFWSVKLPLRHADGRIYALCGISTDITTRKQSEETIYQLAFYDPLTHLPNRRLLQDRLQQVLASVQRKPQGGALMFVDVDNFKDVNDTLGHDAGDLLLQEIATRLQACLRAQDTLGRLGGDEFVVVLTDLDARPEEAARLAQQIGDKILARLAQPYLLAGKTCQCSVSIGVALINQDTLARDELLKQADLAMFQAKAAGRNTLRFFNPDMQARVVARFALENDLHRALQQQEFLLYYQPQVNATGQLLGYEALVRWQHPERGLVPPAHFIPAAEACGAILPLGHWVMQTACQQLVRWQGAAPQNGWTIAVNVSAQQFRQKDFVARVRAVLLETGANATQLELELTESQLVDDVNDVVQKMHDLRSLGVQLSLDDFGTGYSSLAMLRYLPLTQLKIDQGFVRDMLTQAQDASIIRAIISLGESLQLDVIAEGVEQSAQRDALLALGCQHYQGYLFGRPAPLPDNIAALAKDGAADTHQGTA
ncbi:MAG: EAL domain-containing protein [Rhodoferax sp.]|nr:EAL domain-containing protein [Rhodoferax sp.]